MSPKQYDKFQRTVQAGILVIVFSAVAISLLGVYALANLVL